MCTALVREPATGEHELQNEFLEQRVDDRHQHHRSRATADVECQYNEDHSQPKGARPAARSPDSSSSRQVFAEDLKRRLHWSGSVKPVRFAFVRSLRSRNAGPIGEGSKARSTRQNFCRGGSQARSDAQCSGGGELYRETCDSASVHHDWNDVTVVAIYVYASDESEQDRSIVSCPARRRLSRICCSPSRLLARQ